MLLTCSGVYSENSACPCVYTHEGGAYIFLHTVRTHFSIGPSVVSLCCIVLSLFFYTKQKVPVFVGDCSVGDGGLHVQVWTSSGKRLRVLWSVECLPHVAPIYCVCVVSMHVSVHVRMSMCCTESVLALSMPSELVSQFDGLFTC